VTCGSEKGPWPVRREKRMLAKARSDPGFRVGAAEAPIRQAELVLDESYAEAVA